MGIRDKPIAPASRWQNGFAERLIGLIRRECLDQMVVFGEMHLRRILQSYARYCNDVRTHRALDKDAPVSRRVQRKHQIVPHPRRTPSPLCPDLGFRYTQGTLSFGGGAIDCTVRNPSETRAALDVTSAVGIPERFTLLVEADKSNLPCRVVWRKEKKIGVRFET
jgi:hypothetical protein